MVPEKLSDFEMLELDAWCRRRFPGLAHGLEDLVEDCLDWHRALPLSDRRRARGSWPAAARNWIRRHAAWHPEELGQRTKLADLPETRSLTPEQRAEAAGALAAIRDRLRGPRRRA